MDELFDVNNSKDVYDDRTGEKFDPMTRKRLELTETVCLVREGVLIMQAADRPSVSMLALNDAVRAFCVYAGWSPVEVALADRAVALQEALSAAMSTGG